MNSRSVLVVCAAALLCSCKPQLVDPGPQMPVAYVAPANLNLRGQLTNKESVVAVLHYGDRVEVVEAKRRFVKVRTANGKTGWVDAVQLLTADHMAQLQAQQARAATLPSEGAATAFEELNVHLEPNRQSPAFARIAEGASAQVLGHTVTPKTNTPPKIPAFDIPKPATTRKSRKTDTKNAFPFPHITPPKPPEEEFENYEPKQPANQQPEQPAQPATPEDWALVRMKDGRTGWVLSRNLMMSIPDEVAQYAEGKHITSYFDLGVVNDEEKGLKHNWLWTTTSEVEPFDYDAWRVFIWNRRHHRYETSYRKRDVEGYFPVRVDPDGSGFHLVWREGDGKLWLHDYRFDGTLVHAGGQQPLTAALQQQQNGGSGSASQTTKQGWFASHWDALKQKFFRRKK